MRRRVISAKKWEAPACSESLMRIEAAELQGEMRRRPRPHRCAGQGEQGAGQPTVRSRVLLPDMFEPLIISARRSPADALRRCGRTAREGSAGGSRPSPSNTATGFEASPPSPSSSEVATPADPATPSTISGKMSSGCS